MKDFTKKDIPNRRFSICWVKECRYNPYVGVDPNKKRPVLVWINKHPAFRNNILAFYCSKSINVINPDYCVKLSKDKSRLNYDTYVWLTKPMCITPSDIIKTKHNRIDWIEINDEQEKKEINDIVKEIYKAMF